MPAMPHEELQIEGCAHVQWLVGSIAQRLGLQDSACPSSHGQAQMLALNRLCP